MSQNGRIESLTRSSLEPAPLGVPVSAADLALADQQLAGQTFDQIYRLWQTPEALGSPAVRQRAVSILTAPDNHSLPFDCPDQSVARLLAIDRPAFRERLVGRPDLSHELALGALYWQGKEGESTDLRSRMIHQELIQQLLPLVDPEIADRLFSFYKIKDLVPYTNSDFTSGYRPLEALLYDNQILFKYKEAALIEWCVIAENEELGRVQPRRDHERATSQMSEILQMLTYPLESDRQAYDAIIRTIEDTLPPNIPYVSDLGVGNIGVGSVADFIEDPELRSRFLRRHRNPAIGGSAIQSEVLSQKESKLSLGVQPTYFQALQDGSKTIEGRLARTKYSDLRPGDRITITDEGSGQELIMEVQSLHIYPDFLSAFRSRENYQLAVPDARSTDEAVSVYAQFYPDEKQVSEGVIFLELKHASAQNPTA